MSIFRNVQVGFPIVYTSDLIPANEFNETLVTSTRYLPKIMVEAGIVSSTSEVRRNRPDLCITFPDDMTDCIEVKWGKKFLYIIIGKKDPKDPLDFYATDENLIGYSFDGINWNNLKNTNMNGRLYQCKVHLIHVFKGDAEMNFEPFITHFLWK